MRLDLGWSKTGIYGAATLGLTLAGIAAYPVGAAIDRGHGRRVMSLASVGAGLLLVAWSQVTSIFVFYAIFAAIGCLQACTLYAPAFAVIDMRLGDGNGLDVIARLKERRPEARGVILTGYGNIATAVTAVKLGAFDYLAKPADADEIHGTLMAQPGERADPPENPMSADRVRWEHIQRVYELCSRNVSETARRLNMHRRTLQRILAKRAPR